ncbi:MAG: SpoIIE family protein phosphatase [Treponema sp.]|jgi:sigma-B regulation protein RsbU (phosphoserine phosphatase)|nr:SpoIIE family protein phosphatase [Treponema sp.]
MTGKNKTMKLKTRVLAETLSVFIAVAVLFSAVFFLSIVEIRNTALSGSLTLGDHAAGLGSNALEEQLAVNITRIASDLAVIVDEKLSKIENHTRMTADITGSIYSHREAWRPKPLPYVAPGKTAPPEPYVHTAPGVDLSRIREETDLAGNIADMLRQITVIDRAITTSTIGGESGYIIAMDAFPWPSEDFDPRLYSWYREAKDRGDLYWTSVYADPRGRGLAISCAMPFYDYSGNSRVFKGAARSTVMLADLSKLVDSVRVGETGYLFFLDESGVKLFSGGNIDVFLDRNGVIHGVNYLESEDPSLRSLGVSMTLGAGGMTRLEIDGLPVYVAYAPIRALGWSLGVVIPVQEISRPARLIGEGILSLSADTRTAMDRHIVFLAGRIAVLLLCIFIIVTILVLRFSNAVTAPILALNTGVREVSAGNLEREVNIATGDELEQLALSFNTMTARLRAHIAETARVTAEKERIATELDVATQIQTSMLPYLFPPFPDRSNDFELYAEVRPAREVGGDFYDFFFIDQDHFAVIVADVSGKGIPAALFMAVSKTMVRDYLQSGNSPERALESVNRLLCANNTAEMFVTLWLGILEISSRRLDYINAGHNPPLLKSGGLKSAFRDFNVLASPPDLFLAGMEDTRYHCRRAFLEKGDTLFLYTDGVTEAADSAGNLYGRTALRQCLSANASLPVRELVARIRLDINTFTTGAEPSDDMTMLILRIL